ncbi:hypothetical protein PROFUN_01148 [Planoprotostelium fungivorum]|uniref:RRM domain-containing protein n=1 Tax=Planoprotostelium fungivorum TaxID=1890364 RepID=A0A2P6NCE3_9EUKA|nr:hypothetical protein PROFUN_01148 [Planoprotostelium fungivorum]
MNKVRAIEKLNEKEMSLGLAGGEGSWHDRYKDSAYIYVGGLDFNFTEGDIICVFSQYGDIIDINMPKSDEGVSKGFCFLCYYNQKSTVLAVDNLNGIKLAGKTIRVDHCEYKHREETDQEKTDQETIDQERTDQERTGTEEIEGKIDTERRGRETMTDEGLQIAGGRDQFHHHPHIPREKGDKVQVYRSLLYMSPTYKSSSKLPHWYLTPSPVENEDVSLSHVPFHLSIGRNEHETT